MDDTVGSTFSGDVKSTAANYYPSITDAQSDGLFRYWDMQETSGTDTASTEKLGSSETMSCSGGVTITSDTINSNTIYKRVFSGSAYMESSTKLDLDNSS